MTVYVDDARLPPDRKRMCHMTADSTEELLDMASRIGVKRKWLQNGGTPLEHFDICLSKRQLAIKAGAQGVSRRELGQILLARRSTGGKG